jgi:ADP-ribosylglycohydrolase
MRVAPLGAYFADDVERATAEASLSAQVTHAHPEGQAGAMAIAVAACWAWSQRSNPRPDLDALYASVLTHTPASTTRDGISAARELPGDTLPGRAAEALGAGRRVSCQDTVPFCIWSIARNPTSFVDAMWDTVTGLGDRDTTCAIVGGVVALSAGRESIPEPWIRAREELV